MEDLNKDDGCFVPTEDSLTILYHLIKKWQPHINGLSFFRSTHPSNILQKNVETLIPKIETL